MSNGLRNRLQGLHSGCNCLVTRRCKRDGCRLTLGSNAIGVDCDRCRAFTPTQRRPDFIVLYEGGGSKWFVVEMKGKTIRVSNVKERLAKVSINLKPGFGSFVRTRFSRYTGIYRSLLSCCIADEYTPPIVKPSNAVGF